MQKFIDHLRICFPEQGNKCNIPHLEVLQETNFSEMIQENKKAFIFWQVNHTIKVLHPSLSKLFALSICSRDPMKKSTRDNFARVPTAKCIANCNHDGSLEDDYYVPFFKLNFSYPHYVTCFACQSFQIFTA